jgi:hypothetical protein
MLSPLLRPPASLPLRALLHFGIACAPRRLSAAAAAASSAASAPARHLVAAFPDLSLPIRRLALRLHPDKGGREEHFKLLSAAWSTLSDAALRREHFDAMLAYRRRHPRWIYARPTAFDVGGGAGGGGGRG